MVKSKQNIKRLPGYLSKYIVEQDYYKYTAIDHSVWRYIMRLNFDFLQKNAHHSYIDGLAKTGIGIEKIPKIEEMNEILSKIGWSAVCVDGFIPPSAFMEFQAYKVLVIAANIRNINHIEYTPAPDIVHEAAGHAPIIANPAYSEYLSLFGKIGSKAISSKRDIDLYEAIRRISILKENPKSSNELIKQAENHLIEIQNNMGEASEMARLRNLHWWTVEYGLIGSIEKPQIYGAGLLSSIGESALCLKSDVKKIPYSIAAADFNFDITTCQPHLFVTPDFTNLLLVLHEFADKMAFRKGGASGVQLAVDSNATACCELSSGLQISGIFTRMISDSGGQIAYLSTSGPSMLSERNKMILGHGKNNHMDGFGTPVGNLKNCNFKLEDARLNELAEMNIVIGRRAYLEFESGVCVNGFLQYIYQNEFGKNLIFSFIDCTVSMNDLNLFKPEWGIYDMAVGNKVISVFAGAADKEEFESESYISTTASEPNQYMDDHYIGLYQDVRNMRENKSSIGKMEDIFNELKHHYSDDWLLSLELYELAFKYKNECSEEIKKYLLKKAELDPGFKKLIVDGIRLIEK